MTQKAIVIDGKVLPPDLVRKTLQRMRDIQIAQAALDRLYFAAAHPPTASAD